jgi:3-deoxy-D-manno-octulosonic-acid transferase
MNRKIRTFVCQSEYVLRILFFLPNTFLKRVVFGKDPVWKLFFFQSWGKLPKELLQMLRQRESLWINTEAGGELTQAIPLCKSLKDDFPQYNLLISTHKYDSYKLALRIPGVDYAFFSPWDISFVTRKVLKKIRPKLLIAIDIVTAPVLFREAHRLGFTTLLCSGFMNKHVKKHKILMRTMALDSLKKLTFIAAKEQVDKTRFVQLGCSPDSVRVLGDLKYDLLDAEEFANTGQNFLRISGLRKTDKILLGASTHPGDEKVLIDSFSILKDHHPDFKLIIAPRFNQFIEPIEAYLTELNFSHIRKTELTNPPKKQPQVIILDTFGDLPYLYSAASYVFIGASLVPLNPGGGHNPIEPMLHGLPVFHGPHMSKHQDIVDELKTIWTGLQIHTSEELAENILYLEDNHILKKKIKCTIKTIVERNIGSTKRHVEFIYKILS